MIRIQGNISINISNKINMSVEKNAQLTIYGMNGSGKSMLLNSIAGSAVSCISIMD